MPMHAADLESSGVSPKARAAYPERIRTAIDRYHVPFVYFQQHEEDPGFFQDQFDHLGAKGWVYYDKMLDDFFHGRMSSL